MSFSQRVARYFPALVLLLSVFVSSAAYGVTITFGPVVGANETPYLGHVEDTFTVTPTSGDWRNAQIFGNPTPDIFGGPIGSPLAAAIDVTENVTGLFTFHSVDLAGNNSTEVTYSFEGYRNNALVLSQGGVLNQSVVWFTIPSNNPALILDRLNIGLNPLGGASSFNLDNIVVRQAVPEPATLALLAIGAFAAIAQRRRRAA
jgi:hypothetical protein